VSIHGEKDVDTIEEMDMDAAMTTDMVTAADVVTVMEEGIEINRVFE
jgi:hypothetical protein